MWDIICIFNRVLMSSLINVTVSHICSCQMFKMSLYGSFSPSEGSTLKTKDCDEDNCLDR